jgi:hypothetical protein
VPKPYLLGVEIEEVSVGPVMRAIKRLDGVIGVLDLDTQKKSGAELPRANGANVARGPYKPRGQFDVSGEDVVAKALLSEPLMTAGQFKRLFVSQGRSQHSINSVLHGMKQRGELNSSPDGYSLTKKMRDRLRHRKAAKSKKK